jgi:Glyoxalase/Bleomycin resistance protein/Dioxygenase superfamily
MPSDRPAAFYHTGIVVPDLEKAVARFSDIHDIEFTEPLVYEVPWVEDPEPHPLEVASVMSRTGAPYYELIQANGDGIFSLANTGQILYHGVWETDMAARLDHLREHGIGVDATFRLAAGSLPHAVFTEPFLEGTRIEYCDVSSKEILLEWIRTGKSPI